MLLQPAREADEVEVGVTAWESCAWVGDSVEADDTTVAVTVAVAVAVAGLGRVL